MRDTLPPRYPGSGAHLACRYGNTLPLSPLSSPAIAVFAGFAIRAASACVGPVLADGPETSLSVRRRRRRARLSANFLVMSRVHSASPYGQSHAIAAPTP